MKEVDSLEVGEKSSSFLSSGGDIEIQKETYRILGFWLEYLVTIVFIVISIILLGCGILEIFKGQFSIHNFLVPIALIIMSCIITYFFPFYSSITVDLANKEVICKKYKLFFIIKKIVKIEIQNIEKVYTVDNLAEGDENNDKSNVFEFNLVFEMKDGEKIIGLEGEIDKNFERTKVGFFMSQFFPVFEIPKNENPDELIPETEEKQ